MEEGSTGIGAEISLGAPAFSAGSREGIESAISG
jgi:hypothetical protein